MTGADDQEAAVAGAVRQLVSAWPPLTEWQKDQLRALLDGPGDDDE